MTLALHGKSRKRQFMLMMAAFLAVVLGAAAVFAAPPVPGSASQSDNVCDFVGYGYTDKIDWSGGATANTHTAPTGKVIDEVCIKGGAGMFAANEPHGTPFDEQTNGAQAGSFKGLKDITENRGDIGIGNGQPHADGCYVVAGIGSTSVTITEGSDCKDVSHTAVKYKDAPQAPTGSITITKSADPSDDGTPFSFIVLKDSADFGTFDLQHGESKSYPDLAPAKYDFWETNIPADWANTSATCAGATNSTIVWDSGSDKVLEITLASGEDIVCTFYNENDETPGTKTVQVTKTWTGADPSDDDKAAFSVTITPGGDTTAVNCNYDTVMAGDCVATMDEDESYGVKEILPAGWTTDLKWVVGALFNASCEPVQVDASFATVVAEADCVHSITNTKQEQEVDRPVVTFYKYVCEDYASVPANTTDGNTPGQANDVGQPDQVNQSGATLGGEWPFGNNPIPNPPGAFDGCWLADGWSFTLATNQSFTSNATTTDNTSGGMVQIELTQEQLDAAEAGPNNLWVKENYRDGEGYGFGAVKCHTDHLHRDNLEWIDLSGGNYTESPVCVAFNVAPEDPTTTVEAFKVWDGDTPSAELLENFLVTIFPSASDGVTCEWDGTKLVALFTGTPCKVTIGIHETYTIIESGLPQGATGPLEYQAGSAVIFSAATCEEDAPQRLAIVVNGAGCTHTITNSYQAQQICYDPWNGTSFDKSVIKTSSVAWDPNTGLVSGNFEVHATKNVNGQNVPICFNARLSAYELTGPSAVDYSQWYHQKQIGMAHVVVDSSVETQYSINPFVADVCNIQVDWYFSTSNLANVRGVGEHTDQDGRVGRPSPHHQNPPNPLNPEFWQDVFTTPYPDVLFPGGGTNYRNVDGPYTGKAYIAVDGRQCATPTGSLLVTKFVEWNGATPNPEKQFEICVAGPAPSTDVVECQFAASTGGDLTFANLVPGDYTVSETDPGSEWTVTINPSPIAVTLDSQATSTVTNTRQVGTIRIQKDDASPYPNPADPSVNPVAGATFELTNTHTNQVFCVTDNQVVPNASCVGMPKADAEAAPGNTVVTGLPVGRYEIREVEAPANHGADTCSYNDANFVRAINLGVNGGGLDWNLAAAGCQGNSAFHNPAPWIRFTTGDTGICEPLGMEKTGTLEYFVPAGMTLKIQGAFNVVHPAGPTTYTEKTVVGPEKGTFDIVGQWPGIDFDSLDPNNPVVEIHFGGNMLNEQGNPIGQGFTASLDYFWNPSVCDIVFVQKHYEGAEATESDIPGITVSPDPLNTITVNGATSNTTTTNWNPVVLPKNSWNIGVTETLNEKWDFKSGAIVCKGAGAADPAVFDATSVNFTYAGGAPWNTVCRVEFTNEYKKSRLVIEKVVTNGETRAPFKFSLLDKSNFELDFEWLRDGETWEHDDLEPGTYWAKEWPILTPGWDLYDVVCRDNNIQPDVEVRTLVEGDGWNPSIILNAVKVELDHGDDITCTFYNRPSHREVEVCKDFLDNGDVFATGPVDFKFKVSWQYKLLGFTKTAETTRTITLNEGESECITVSRAGLVRIPYTADVTVTELPVNYGGWKDAPGYPTNNVEACEVVEDDVLVSLSQGLEVDGSTATLSTSDCSVTFENKVAPEREVEICKLVEDNGDGTVHGGLFGFDLDTKNGETAKWADYRIEQYEDGEIVCVTDTVPADVEVLVKETFGGAPIQGFPDSPEATAWNGNEAGYPQYSVNGGDATSGLQTSWLPAGTEKLSVTFVNKTETNPKLIVNKLYPDSCVAPEESDRPEMSLAGNGATLDFVEEAECDTWETEIEAGKTYTVTEQLQHGWALVDYEVSGEGCFDETNGFELVQLNVVAQVFNNILGLSLNPPLAHDVRISADGPGVECVVTFINEPIGEIVLVKKRSMTLDEAWDFTISDVDGPVTVVTDQGPSGTDPEYMSGQVAVTLPVGSYSVTEVLGANQCVEGSVENAYDTYADWAVDSLPDPDETDLIGGAPLGGIQVTKGQTTFVVFENAACGEVLSSPNLIIRKFIDNLAGDLSGTTPSNDFRFRVTVTPAEGLPFETIVEGSAFTNGVAIVLGLPTGTVVVEELTPPAGFELTGHKVDLNNNGSTDAQGSGQPASFEIGLDQTHSVSFYNRQLPQPQLSLARICIDESNGVAYSVSNAGPVQSMLLEWNNGAETVITSLNGEVLLPAGATGARLVATYVGDLEVQTGLVNLPAGELNCVVETPTPVVETPTPTNTPVTETPTPVIETPTATPTDEPQEPTATPTPIDEVEGEIIPGASETPDTLATPIPPASGSGITSVVAGGSNFMAVFLAMLLLSTGMAILSFSRRRA